ncbi:MAG: hypothetical protein ISS51_00495 [Dehalococcoidales bacterium]|nr:hypothetical protein [Dehalococcoidales bacterium]
MIEVIESQKLTAHAFETHDTHALAILINAWLQKSNAVIHDVIVFPQGEQVAAIVLYEGSGAENP